MRDSAVGAAYGLAEATVAVSFSRVDQPLTVDVVWAEALEKQGRAVATSDAEAPKKDLVIVGPPMAGMEVRIAGDEGRNLPARHVGEIAIRGDGVCRTYLTPDGEGAAVDGDGWIHTGDLGYFTDDGEIVVCGRRKDVIIVAGRNIFPANIERLAEAVDGVRRGAVAAFGITQSDRREEIGIVAETVQEYPSDISGEIRRQIARRVLNATGLSPHVLLVGRGAIPKTPSGKIRHLAAKETFGKSIRCELIRSVNCVHRCRVGA